MQREAQHRCGSISVCDLLCRHNLDFGSTQHKCGSRSVCNLLCRHNLDFGSTQHKCGSRSVCNLLCRRNLDFGSTHHKCGSRSVCNLLCRRNLDFGSTHHKCGSDLPVISCVDAIWISRVLIDPHWSGSAPSCRKPHWYLYSDIFHIFSVSCVQMGEINMV